MATIEAKSEWQLPSLPQLPSVFRKTPATPTLEAESEWQLSLLPQLPSVFRETPSPLFDYSLRLVYNMGIDSH